METNIDRINALVDDFCAAIIDGELTDSHRENIAQAYKHARAMESYKAIAQLKQGDIVRFKQGNIKPQYLAGVQGVVVGFAQKRVWVKVDDHPRARRFAGLKVRTPATTLEVVVSSDIN